MPRGSKHLRISQDDILHVAGRAQFVLDLITHASCAADKDAALNSVAVWCEELIALQQRDTIIAEYHNAHKRKQPGG